MNFRQNSVVFLATGGYIGYIPTAPGTFGTLWGLLFGFILSFLPFYGAFVCLIGFGCFAIWIADQAQDIIQQKDPGCIVIDEILGLVVGIAGLPFNAYSALVGFILFRVFDIFKPFPVNWIDQRCSGGVGIVLDDVMAGIYTNLALRLGIFLFNI